MIKLVKLLLFLDDDDREDEDELADDLVPAKFIIWFDEMDDVEDVEDDVVSNEFIFELILWLIFLPLLLLFVNEVNADVELLVGGRLTGDVVDELFILLVLISL